MSESKQYGYDADSSTDLCLWPWDDLRPINWPWPVAGLIFNIMCIQKTIHHLYVYAKFQDNWSNINVWLYGNVPQYHFFQLVTRKAHFLGSDIPQTYAFEVEYLHAHIR